MKFEKLFRKNIILRKIILLKVFFIKNYFNNCKKKSSYSHEQDDQCMKKNFNSSIVQ